MRLLERIRVALVALRKRFARPREPQPAPDWTHPNLPNGGAQLVLAESWEGYEFSEWSARSIAFGAALECALTEPCRLWCFDHLSSVPRLVIRLDTPSDDREWILHFQDDEDLILFKMRWM